jgi:superfamily I DNA/RNA helicase
MVTAMLHDAGDEAEDEEDGDGDDDGEAEEAADSDRGSQPALHGRRLVADVFRRAMRSLALRLASGSKPTPASRAGRILAFLNDRGLDAPDLKDLGKILLLQRAAGRLAGAPANYLRRIPARYRGFRRAMRAQGVWYGGAGGRAHQVHPAELDVIVLTMLRVARRMDGDRLLASRLAERRPPLLDAIAGLRRNQVLVDEATDFSPIQLASMGALASPRTGSLFLSGDFNQRLTRWGARALAELKWVTPALQVHDISVTYRQSRKLAAFSRSLARLQGAEIDDRTPDFAENLGFDPIYASGLADDRARAAWLTDRIREIERVSVGQLPSIAVLVPDRDGVDSLAAALNYELAALSLQAKAYIEGEAIGKTNDVRVFPVEHIKGLEFEAVFFLDVDHLAEVQPELFDRYIYVGSTRAATFLGLTSRGPALPPTLAHSDLVYGQSW